MSYTEPSLRLAAARHGVLTASRARHHGVPASALQRLVDSGAFVRVAKGVYVSVGAPRTFEQDVAVAIACAGGDAWAAGPCAARLWDRGRPFFTQAKPEIVILHGRRCPTDAARFARVRTARHLDAVDRAVWKGLPVTTQLRTVIDLLDYRNAAAVDALADDVLMRAGPRPSEELRGAWARSGRRRGGGALERILAPWEQPGPPPESPKEMTLVRLLVDAGLPMPERQVEIRDPVTRRVIGRADHAYPEARLAIEYLGGGVHGVRQAHGDVLRDADLRAVGWRAAYARKSDLADPTGYVAGVAALLHAERDGGCADERAGLPQAGRDDAGAA